MKKARNILVFALMLATVASMGSVAGTYAKYISTSTTTDEARVAKWGFSMDDKSYENVDLFKDSSKVLSTAGTKDDLTVIAPGTSGTYSFTVDSKTTEVDYRVTLVATVTDGVKLTEAEAQSVVSTHTGEYAPIKYTLTNTTTGTAVVEDVDAATLQAELNKLYTGTVITAGTTENSTYKIDWEWAAEVDADTNKLDTLLGQNATGKTVKLEIEITAEQDI